jgi:hypothetical protein
MDASKVNYLAALVAALSSFLIGGLWYSPILFAKAWMRETGLSDEQLRTGVARTFVSAFVLSLVMALNPASSWARPPASPGAPPRAPSPGSAGRRRRSPSSTCSSAAR